ncbi:hypothetical protein FRC02_002130 [Tulasnella sp. 418]|nr:hypothetical protein FRC02_002130 [Tulasnella sp. 418]
MAFPTRRRVSEVLRLFMVLLSPTIRILLSLLRSHPRDRVWHPSSGLVVQKLASGVELRLVRNPAYGGIAFRANAPAAWPLTHPDHLTTNWRRVSSSTMPMFQHS